MIIARFTAFLRRNRRTVFPRSLSTSLRTQHERAHTHTHTHTEIRACRGYISQRRSSLYVNCIRNSEYPANFLHTDHSRISAKRTSIRRSLHHKFRRTWCNAHLVEAPTLHSGCAANERVPLRDVARLCPTDSRVFRVFGTLLTRILRGYLSSVLNSMVIF